MNLGEAVGGIVGGHARCYRHRRAAPPPTSPLADDRRTARRFAVDGTRKPAARRGNRVSPLSHPACRTAAAGRRRAGRTEEPTSELQPLMRISYAFICLKK